MSGPTALGPIGSALEVDLAALGGALAERNTRTLAETARRLARSLDGDPGLILAGVARELRVCLGALGLGGAQPGVDDDDTAALLARMSAPVRDSAPAGARNVRARGGRAGGGDGAAAAAVAADRG